MNFLKKHSGTLNLILMWILFSLLAIAFIGTRPFVGLAIAVIGGIILGIFSFADFEARQREEWERRQREVEAGSAGVAEEIKDDEVDQDADKPSLEDAGE